MWLATQSRCAVAAVAADEWFPPYRQNAMPYKPETDYSSIACGTQEKRGRWIQLVHNACSSSRLTEEMQRTAC